MRAVRGGDLAQLGILFERYHGPVFDFLSRMTGDRVAAEDMVQDVFMRILKYRSTFRDEGTFETWLFRIARNARADYFRQRPVTEPLAEEALERPESQPGPAGRLEASRERARLRQALLRLREDKREILVLARYRDLKYEQIAEILGIEVGAVKVRVHRAVRELREIYLQLRDENPSWNATTSRRTFQII
jgi:RNA polymerase sigma factor (sigma-70 family)